MMNGEQYLDSLRAQKLRVFLFGEQIDNLVDHPMIRPSLNAVAQTYELACDEQYKELMTANSSLSGKPVNRFTHLHQNTDDLIKKVKMQRLLGQKTAVCFQRCVGFDAFNAVDSVTFEMDRELNTDYNRRFRDFLLRVQEQNLVVDGAMTDPKGDRSLRPHQQADPDLYLRVIKKDDHGIVVRGAKAHQTGALASHEILVMPTVAMGEEDAAQIVEYNGAARASHVKDKLIEMIHLNETLFACGIACSSQGHATSSGTYLIDLLLANVCKQNVTRFPYEIARLAEDLAGGLMVTMPSEKDFRHPEIGPYLNKYLKGVSSVPTEHRQRMLRLIENLTMGAAAVGYRTESMHGAGSPQAQRVMIQRQGKLEDKKGLARIIAGIDKV